MKFAPFDYVAPRTVADVFDVLASEPEARPLAGGQSLLPLLALRLSSPSVLVDLERVERLSEVEDDGGVVRIGAMARQADCEQSPVVRRRLPLLAEALAQVGHPAIRNRGTVGGSLAHADPAAELPVVMTALDAEMRVGGPGGDRSVPAAEFFVGPFETALQPGELLTRVDVPVPQGRWVFMELARRCGDFAVAMTAVGLEFDDGHCSRARIVLGGISTGVPARATAAEEVVAGARLDAAVAQQAADRAVAGLEFQSDLQGSAEYRRHVTAVLVRRALLEAAAPGARGGPSDRRSTA